MTGAARAEARRVPAATPQRPPTTAPAKPAKGAAGDSKIGSANSTAGAAAGPNGPGGPRDRDANRVVVLVELAPGLGATDREPGRDRAQRHPVAAGDHGEVALGVGDARCRQHPQRAAGEQEEAGGGGAAPTAGRARGG